VRKFLLILIVTISLISCQKEDMLINQYEKNLTDSTIVDDTVSKKIKLYDFVDKLSSKKEPVKKKKRKRFKFRDFIKSKFRKD
jgi:hypothetical protein